MNKVTAVSVTLHDLSGAPLNPSLVSELERKVEYLAQQDKGLVVNVAKVE
jgi:hypothetical protein